MNVDLLLKNASQLLTCRLKNPERPKTGKELAKLGVIENGAVAVENGKIVFVGTNRELNKLKINPKKIVDVKNKVVMPGFVDCHTHAVFAGSRENEFLKKLQGVSYLEILKHGGGILSTVRKTRKASKKELFDLAKKRLKRILEYGTTTIEIKSGYGLTLRDEVKILEVTSMLERKLPIDIVKTYLGAHVVPKGTSKEKYIKQILGSLKKVKRYAEFCDVFCEKGIFSVSETKEILNAAKKQGFKLKIHSEQINTLNSAKLAASLSVVSADHLENITSSGIAALARKGVIGVLLPGVPFYLMESKYAPARRIIDGGVPIAIATDFNPGSCPSFNMQLIISLACLKLKMTPAEAINAATINAAFAVDRASTIGSLEAGKKADIIILEVDNYNKLPYYFGINLVEKVIKNGEIVIDKEKSF